MPREEDSFLSPRAPSAPCWADCSGAAHVDSLAPLPPLPGLIRRLGPRGLDHGGWFERHLLHDGRRALLGLPTTRRLRRDPTRLAWATGRSRGPLTGARIAAEASRSAAFRCARSSVARCSACLRFCAQSAAASDACAGGSRGVNGWVRAVAKNKVGICASPRERGTKHRARGRDGADARGAQGRVPGAARPTIQGP